MASHDDTPGGKDDADQAPDRARNEAAADDGQAGDAGKSDTAPPAAQPAASAPPKRSGIVIAALAFILALAGLAAGLYGHVARADGAREQLGADLGTRLDAALANLPDGDAIVAEARRESERASGDLERRVDQRLSSVDLSAVEELAEQVTRFDNQLRGQQRSLGTLTQRISGMEEDMSALAGVSASVRNTWVRAEAEYFLQTANSRLQLAGDLDSALQALRAADERIGVLGDPGLTPVRAALAEEILALESVPRIDAEGMALVLNGMIPRVRELPFESGRPDNFEVERAPETDTPNGWGRAKEAVGEVFGGIVRVTPSDGRTLELLAPQETWFLVRNLELQLQVARVALMEKDIENYRGSLRSAIAWLDEYFDTEDIAVRRMRDRLTEMEQVDIDPELPDISGSLRLLRQIAATSSAS